MVARKGRNISLMKVLQNLGHRQSLTYKYLSSVYAIDGDRKGRTRLETLCRAVVLSANSSRTSWWWWLRYCNNRQVPDGFSSVQLLPSSHITRNPSDSDNEDTTKQWVPLCAFSPGTKTKLTVLLPCCWLQMKFIHSVCHLILDDCDNDAMKPWRQDQEQEDPLWALTLFAQLSVIWKLSPGSAMH